MAPKGPRYALIRANAMSRALAIKRPKATGREPKSSPDNRGHPQLLAQLKGEYVPN